MKATVTRETQPQLGLLTLTATVQHHGKTFTDSLTLHTTQTELPPGSEVTYPYVPTDPTVPAAPTRPTQPTAPTQPTQPTQPIVTPLWQRFKDLDPQGWYIGELEAILQAGLMNGTGPDTFEPGLATSRAMIVTILYRLEGEPAVSDAAGFDDVPADSWYGPAVAWAQSNGIVKGYGNGKFGSTDPITREQLAAILYRYSQYRDYDVSRAADLSKYADAGDISGWALDAMRWANAEGLINGRTAKTLVPKGEATRVELAAIMKRFMDRIG